jgi:hypothetical protein
LYVKSQGATSFLPQPGQTALFKLPLKSSFKCTASPASIRLMTEIDAVLPQSGHLTFTVSGIAVKTGALLFQEGIETNRADVVFKIFVCELRHA